MMKIDKIREEINLFGIDDVSAETDDETKAKIAELTRNLAWDTILSLEEEKINKEALENIIHEAYLDALFSI